MRLTTIDRLTLPRGHVSSFAVRLDEQRRPLPISFDQRRHVSLGDRPASWMSLAIRLPDGTPREATRDRIAQAWLAVVRRHGTLATVFSREADGSLRLDAAGIRGGEWCEHPVDDPARPQDTVRRVFDEACSPFQRPSHRLCLVEPDDGSAPVIVIASDHAHVDIWSLAVAARDLVDALAALASGAQPQFSAAAAFAEHTAALESAPPAPRDVHDRWARIMDAGGGALPRFPLPLGDLDQPQPAIVEVRDVADAAGLARMSERAAERGATLTTLALGVLVDVSQRLAGLPLRAVFPVHSRTEDRWRDSMGWYITNAVIECADPEPASCGAALTAALSLGSYPLAPILAPYLTAHGGMPEPPGMFALSWLDTRRLPVRLEPEWQAKWVSAVMKVNGVMIWFLVNDGIHLRCRYPDTPEARANVGRWLDDIEAGLRALAQT